MKKKNWWVYMIVSSKGQLYTGITTDIERRFREHAGEGGKGAKFFRSTAPSEVVYRKKCADRSAASKLEAKIKKLRREQKLALIESTRA